jgi:hypothetical protein
MFLAILFSSIALVAGVVASALLGRRKLIKRLEQNNRIAELIVEFQGNFVQWANSRGQDQSAYRAMSFDLAKVERALGRDNFVVGVKVGRYFLNGTPILPLAVHEMSNEFSWDLYSGNRGADIAREVQTVIFRHLGRREDIGKSIWERLNNFGSCAAEGWLTVAAIPVAVLSVFGIVKGDRVDAVRDSVGFRIWGLISGICVVGGPVIAYLADRTEIDATVRNMFG